MCHVIEVLFTTKVHVGNLLITFANLYVLKYFRHKMLKNSILCAFICSVQTNWKETAWFFS